MFHFDRYHPLQAKLLNICVDPSLQADQKVAFVDGGMVANNPAMISVFESHSLWPDEPIGKCRVVHLRIIGMPSACSYFLRRLFSITRDRFQPRKASDGDERYQ
jgi:hypothetical protein